MFWLGIVSASATYKSLPLQWLALLMTIPLFFVLVDIVMAWYMGAETLVWFMYAMTSHSCNIR
jgi:hypothetical protein